MRRLVPLVLVALGALVAGVVITGLPSHVPSDVVSQGITTIAHASGDSSRAATMPPETTTTSTPPPVPPTPAPTDPPPTTTSVPLSPPSSIPATAPPTPPPTVVADPGQLVVVVANAGPADRLAARMAAEINALGYAQTVVTTASARRPVSEVYFAPGRDQEGLALASGIGLADTQVHPYSDAPLAVDDPRGDLWLVVGTDLVQRFEAPA